MNPILKNILAVFGGLIVGSMVNMGLIAIGGKIILPPSGVDVTDMESLKTSMHLFEARHFIFPFLAHALGTFAGAYIASWLAASHKMKFAIGSVHILKLCFFKKNIFKFFSGFERSFNNRTRMNIFHFNPHNRAALAGFMVLEPDDRIGTAFPFNI